MENFKIGDRVKDAWDYCGTIYRRYGQTGEYIVELDDGRHVIHSGRDLIKIHHNAEGFGGRARNEHSHDTLSTEEQIAYYEAENRRLFSKLYVKLLYKELLDIKDVIFNNPATIVLWADGTKTVVKAGGDDVYDPEKGLAMCFVKKALGNKGAYYDKIKEWLPIPYEPVEHDECESIDSLIKKCKDIQKKYNKHEETSTPVSMTVDLDSVDISKETELLSQLESNRYGELYHPKRFYAGKKHRIVCAGDCYHVKNIKKENMLVFNSLQDALDFGCTPCKHCNGKHNDASIISTLFKKTKEEK